MTLTFLFASLYNIFPPNSLFFTFHFYYFFLILFYLIVSGPRNSSVIGNCPHCKKEYSNLSSLKYHVRLVHSEASNQLCCFLCPAAFVSRPSFKEHLLKNHGVRNHWWEIAPYFVKLYNITYCCVFNKVIQKMQVFIQTLHHDNDYIHN